MLIKLDPTNQKDYRSYIDNFNCRIAEIVDDSKTEANTVKELVLNNFPRVDQGDQLHFKIREFTFEDIHYSRHKNVYTVNKPKSRSGGEFFVEITMIDPGSHVGCGTIPILSEVRRTDAAILRVFSMELELKGVLKNNDTDGSHSHSSYLKTEDVFLSPSQKEPVDDQM